MALTQKQRDERRREKEAKLGAEELRIKALSGEKQMARDIMEWTDDSEQASVVLASLRYMHSLGPAGAREAMATLRARHAFVVSDSVAQAIYDHGVRSILNSPNQDVDDENEAPL
ncbi:hypothetical protein V2K57_11720 [Pseudomonas alliivorans]|nr:hypothetical protein [Pseudomonas alliivorans]MEE4701422.1 hypothetical protein [Pseudomonas alliivorans]MEE4737044.1 hypothetical protein [Pseudomonas alliivorans]